MQCLPVLMDLQCQSLERQQDYFVVNIAFCPSLAGSKYTTAQEIGTRLLVQAVKKRLKFFRCLPFRSIFRLERPIEIAGSCAAVNQEGGSGNKHSFITHQKLRYICNFVCGSRAPCGTIRKHILVEITTRPVELIKRQRRHDNSWGNGVETRATLSPFDGLCHHALFIAAFRDLIGMQRIPDIFRLQQRKIQQFFCRRSRQQFIFLGRQGGHTPAGPVTDDMDTVRAVFRWDAGSGQALWLVTDSLLKKGPLKSRVI